MPILIVSTFISLIVGISVGWLFFRHKAEIAREQGRGEGRVELAILQERASQIPKLTADLSQAIDHNKNLLLKVSDLQAQVAGIAQERQSLEKEVLRVQRVIAETESERDNLRTHCNQLSIANTELETTLKKERLLTDEKLTILNDAKEALTTQFKVLASEILDEKSKKFTEKNQANLSQLLDPLQEKIKAFQAKVEEVYVNEGKDRSALAEQVKTLTQLNNTLSQDTQNLTLALKGDRKTQGNWGEIILDDVLEKAGLLRGQHYERQGSVKSEDGQAHVIPDVVIHLPGERHLVVDSKMTLPDYRAFASAENELERASALKRHLASIRAHIKGLSEKNYQTLYGLKSLDFVVMFIPLEPAFMLAVTNDRDLFQQAWDKNVLLVSPSTLLFVVRTVAYLWRQEGLSRNAKEISNRGAELYEKLVGFVADLQKVGERIQQAQESYNEARRKFSEGSGNVIRQAEMLKKLGVKPSKTLPGQWVDPASEEFPPTLTNESANDTP